jgi:hypothetical protein
MASDDVTLQDLIVRALTGMDERAKKSLERAAAADPKLKQFYAELDEVVSVLAGSKDWRNEKPSAELTAKIRNAVAEKLSAAPPQFRTVVLEADLGRKRTLAGVALAIVAVVILVVGAMEWFNLHPVGPSGPLALSRQVVYESPLKEADVLSGWEPVGEGTWEADAQGLHEKGSQEPAALFRRDGFDAGRALAFEVLVKTPELVQPSSIIVFLAESTGIQPAFNPGVRPAQALQIEISRDGMVLLAPDQSLLQSKPPSNQPNQEYRIRLEHLGSKVRVLVDGNVFFEGTPGARPLSGRIHPGVRVYGPRKQDVRFSDARIEK